MTLNMLLDGTNLVVEGGILMVGDGTGVTGVLVGEGEKSEVGISCLGSRVGVAVVLPHGLCGVKF